MMYMGSKRRVAKHILPIMLEARGDRTWVEPFVGGANMIDKVDGKRIGSDIHPYLIALLRAIQDGWVPPERVDKETYYQIKTHPDLYPSMLVGFVGFLCSFGGKWWCGYARPAAAGQGKRSLLKQAPELVGVEFRHGSYLEIIVPENSLVYCDPPYQNTTRYKDPLDYDQFWQWCRDKTKEGHLVYISEYSSPDDFLRVVEIEQRTTLCKSQNNARRVEKLFFQSSPPIRM